MHDESLHVCTTSREAACSILHHSFAIVRVDRTTASSLDRAWRAARSFFASASSSEQSCPVTIMHKYRRIVGGNLLGYNVPSEAKILFRSICSDWGVETMGQPWPDDMDGGEIRCASVVVASKLHSLLIDCLDEIKLVEKERVGGEVIHPKKRQKLSCSTINSSRSTSSTKAFQERAPNSGTSVIDRTEKNIQIPRTLKEARYCPLDFFLYHGSKSRPVINCSEHIDRGVLICVSLTDVPGLEVLPRNSQRFICPEILSKSEALCRDRSSGCTDLVCIMAGDQLGAACGLEKYVPDDGRQEERNVFSACVHRVKKQVERARLSITYELRGTTAAST